MRWFNWVGMLMLVLGLAINEAVFFYVWTDFHILWAIGLGSYFVVALGLSLWGGPARAED
ncbi:MAG: hypothetical protein HP491_19540 [Nitrospira sp.]|nr:hypothetical protein [Nitrospira sp.]MBH0183653.1 hypothetical protein [Nitrospira sp.]MBH0186183.1 hypothetical protein [Nitrospira sp.]